MRYPASLAPWQSASSRCKDPARGLDSNVTDTLVVVGVR